MHRVYAICHCDDTATRMAYPSGNSTIKPFSTTLDERRAKLAAHILRSSDNDPMRQVTYKPGSADAVDVGKRRIGRPRQHWIFHSNQLIHNLSCLRHLTTSKMKPSLQLHASVESKTMFRPTPWCPSTSLVLLWMSATGAWRKKKCFSSWQCDHRA